MSLVLLICLFTQLRLSGGAVYERRLLVKFSAGKNWNDARKVCAMSGGYLATIDEYTTSFLQQDYKQLSLNYWDNIWIGLHDAAPGAGSILGANGFVWDTCQMLGHWSDWQPNQPANRYNNWCVRLIYNDAFRWYPEQCTSLANYLCQYNTGPCTNLRDASDGCTLQSAGLSSVKSNRTEESSCREHCFLFLDDSSSICWGFNFSSSLVCTLLVGKTPIFCSGDKKTAYNNATQATWVRECFEVRHNTSIVHVDVISNNNAFPSNHCASFSTYYPEMTSQYSERATAVSGATVPLTNSTGMQTTSAGMVANHSTTAEPVTSHTTTARKEAATGQSTTIRAGVTNQPTELSTILETEGVTNQPTAFVTLVATTTPSAKVRYNFTCPCVCVLDRPAPSITKDSLDEIKKELAVDRSSLSSRRRKKESAPDSRVSAQATGLVGVVCLLVAACVIVVPDLGAIIQHVWTDEVPDLQY